MSSVHIWKCVWLGNGMCLELHHPGRYIYTTPGIYWKLEHIFQTCVVSFAHRVKVTSCIYMCTYMCIYMYMLHIRNLACSYYVVSVHGVRSVMMYMYMCIHTSTWLLQHILVFQLVSNSTAGCPSGSCSFMYTPYYVYIRKIHVLCTQ